MTTEKQLSIGTRYNSLGVALVRWEWGELEGFLIPSEAIERGLALISIAAMAEAEATIAEELCRATQSPLVAVLRLVRTARRPLTQGINPIYGLKTKQSMVEIFWYGDQLCLDLAEARYHGQAYLEAAESARTDNYMLSAFADVELVFNPEVREQFFESFRKYRQQMEIS